MLAETYPKAMTLKNGRSVVLRPLTRDDFGRLFAFFQALPEEDHLFFRHNVHDPHLVRRWTEELDYETVVPLLALDGDEVVGNGSLHLMTHGWMRHVGHIRLVVARACRQQGLGGLMTRELVALAAERDLEKLQAHVIEDNASAIKMLEALGFSTVAVLDGMVKDRAGRTRNLAIMVNDVANLTRIMEDWIRDSILPSFRIPGGEG